ncbi:MAG TPA: zinc-ribbon domain-containing protein, partial [Candidatus Paceibacterota bacterium]
MKRIVPYEKSLAYLKPAIAAQWHPTKNKTLNPKDVTCGTQIKIWWICNNCNYEWNSSVSNRKKIDCPKCNRKKGIEKRNRNLILEKGSLLINRPDLAEQWNYKKNKTLTPDNVTCSSNKKVWWQCGKGHEWQTMISVRINGSNCPFCCGHKVSEDTCLAFTHPKLSEQWHPTKNNYLTPYNVSAGSEKRIWWKCKKGHEWNAFVFNRTREKSIGCPFCLNRNVDAYNSLSACNPELAKQWHPSKNGVLSPDNVVSGSGRKVWWKCAEGHEWQARIVDRVKRGHGCLLCLNY